MDYSKLAEFYREIERTTTRTRITELLVELFKSTPGDLIDKVVYLSVGRIAPEFTGLEYNFGEKLPIKALADVLEMDEHLVEEKVVELGDLGDAGERLYEEKGVEPHRKLTVEEVYGTLIEIAKTTGVGSLKKWTPLP